MVAGWCRAQPEERSSSSQGIDSTHPSMFTALRRTPANVAHEQKQGGKEERGRKMVMDLFSSLLTCLQPQRLSSDCFLKN